jgi:hypothetical protein
MLIDSRLKLRSEVGQLRWHRGELGVHVGKSRCREALFYYTQASLKLVGEISDFGWFFFGSTDAGSPQRR